MMSLKVVYTSMGLAEYPVNYCRMPLKKVTLVSSLPSVLRRWEGIQTESYFAAKMTELGFYWVRCRE